MPGPSSEVYFYEAGGHGAEASIAALSLRAQAKVYAYLQHLRETPRLDVRLKKTSLEELWEKKYDLPEGGLRILFAFGLEGKLWCLGAFVKRNDNEGNRFLKNRYEKIAIIASRS